MTAQPLRVVLFLSHRASGLDQVLGSDAAPYRVVGALTTSTESQAIPLLERAGVPWVHHDPREFHRARAASLADRAVRRAFDRESLGLISPFAPDALALVGYLYVVTAPILGAFPGRVVNLHDADLLLLGEDGLPRYPGLHAVRDAILAGEPETRSTAHLVTEELDGGPALVRSAPFPIHAELVAGARAAGREDVLRAYAYAHREWMVEATWGRLLDAALRLLAEGRVRVSAGRAWVGGLPGPVTLEAVARAEAG